jgi:hypothetical protein
LTIYTEYHIGCYVCWIFMESDILVVICARLLNRVLHWLLYVMDFYTEYHLGCYVFSTFIQRASLVAI